ncbi:Protein of unknown function [Sulfitobacter litoralis]|uniref:DUF1403 family protein n=2 Tax=Sulfitobacter litoralis TaxID=335975 RepID=A0ABY0SUE3_9RHOB|nr:Protein of unknown function [Sulfitobacter litoralis]
MPSWVISRSGDTLGDVAFFSGAALGHLHIVMARADVPQGLLRERLALRAAEASVAFSGRPERAADLRDAVHLLRPGDLPGPAGLIYQHWRKAIERPVSIIALYPALPTCSETDLAVWLGRFGSGPGGPVGRASAVLEAVMSEYPRAEHVALILADAVMAQALGWDYAVPLLGGGLSPRDLRKTGDNLRHACHRAVVASAVEATRMAADLARRAARLNAVAPKLRAKGAGAAVEMFLTRDAVAPWALPLSDRAARRLCDRLVSLGAVREVTGRDSFRLYGI